MTVWWASLAEVFVRRGGPRPQETQLRLPMVVFQPRTSLVEGFCRLRFRAGSTISKFYAITTIDASGRQCLFDAFDLLEMCLSMFDIHQEIIIDTQLAALRMDTCPFPRFIWDDLEQLSAGSA
jgi:hypothetical protein